MKAVRVEKKQEGLWVVSRGEWQALRKALNAWGDDCILLCIYMCVNHLFRNKFFPHLILVSFLIH